MVYCSSMYVREGFLGQRLRVIPRPLVESARARPVLRRLLVTDAGCFPHAAAHGRSRPEGAAETIVMVCTEGAGWVEVGDGRPERVQRGDAVAIAAVTGHRYHADVRDPWTIWWMHVVGDDADDFTSIIGAAGENVVPLRDVYSAVQSLESVVAALEEDETTAMLITAAGAAWGVLAQVTASRMLGAAATNERVRNVQEYLRANLDTTFSVPELASMAGLSPSHFSSLFRSATGTSVKEYLKRLRSARARELLIMSELSVTEIAAAVGYQDALYFSRQFRSINGVSPSQFRERVASEALAPSTAERPSSSGADPERFAAYRVHGGPLVDQR